MISKELNEKMNLLIQDVMTAGNAAGIAIAAVNHKGEILYENYAGYRDREKKLPLNRDTIFGLASISKSFTSICILQLAEKGLLSLDDPVSEYVPEFTCKNQSEPVRIRHFLSHAGGYFPLHRTCVNAVAEEIGLSEEQEGDFAYSEKLALAGTRIVAGQMDAQERLLSAPGDRMSYCNDGFGLLSEVVRRVSGERSFADYVVEHICKPLGMSRSCADFLTPATDLNAATLYSVQEDGPHADHDYHRQAFVLGGGGAMKSTLADMCRYGAMFLNDGRALGKTMVLSRRSLRSMTRPYVENGPYGFYGYGLTHKVMDDLNVWGHGGSLPGVSSQFSFSRELDAAVIVLCNTEDVSSGILADGVLRILNGLDPIPPRMQFREITWSQDQLSDVCGEYVSAEGHQFTISQTCRTQPPSAIGTDGRTDSVSVSISECVADKSIPVVPADTANISIPVMLADGKEKAVVPIHPDRLLIRGRFSDTFVEFIRDDAGVVYAARYGSRVFPKVLS